MEPGVNRDRFWCLSESGESPLYLAAKRGRHGVVKAIVRSGSPRAKEAVELRDHILGATPVFVAALHAHRKACRELAIHGRADLTSKPTMHDEFRKVSAEEVRCGAVVPSRRRRDACPSHNEVGGFFSDVEAVSRPRCSAQAAGGVPSN